MLRAAIQHCQVRKPLHVSTYPKIVYSGRMAVSETRFAENVIPVQTTEQSLSTPVMESQLVPILTVREQLPLVCHFAYSHQHAQLALFLQLQESCSSLELE